VFRSNQIFDRIKRGQPGRGIVGRCGGEIMCWILDQYAPFEERALEAVGGEMAKYSANGEMPSTPTLSTAATISSPVT
jgi:hypothetical protein